MLSSGDISVAAEYFAALNRSPDPGGLGTWGYLVQSGQQTLVQVADAMVGTAEFAVAHAGESRTQTISDFYEHGLGREADAAGLAYWDHSGLSLGQVLAAIAGSTEAHDANVWAIAHIDLAVWSEAPWPTSVDRAPIVGGHDLGPHT